MTEFEEFSRIVRGLEPRTAVVLGSGLGTAAEPFRQHSSISFGQIPGLVPTTVHGHSGRLAAGYWHDSPVLLFLGRLHLYEGHPREVVIGPVRTATALGIRRLVLTNAAGGIHPALDAGSLMAIRGHALVVGKVAWHALALGTLVSEPYSRSLIEAMSRHAAAGGTVLHAGIYTALTGPCYETPAEIRALAACGFDAVGMSTAMEAETAAALGLEVAAISCITNRAAGLGGDSLDHAEVLANAKLATEQLRELLSSIIAAP